MLNVTHELLLLLHELFVRARGSSSGSLRRHLLLARSQHHQLTEHANLLGSQVRDLLLVSRLSLEL